MRLPSRCNKNNQLVILIANPIKNTLKEEIETTFGVDIIDKTIIENSIHDNPKSLNSFYYFSSCIPCSGQARKATLFSPGANNFCCISILS